MTFLYVVFGKNGFENLISITRIPNTDYRLPSPKMEKIVSLHIQKLPEGVYLATSNDVQGLVAQGRTVAETLEIARDLAKKLLEEQSKEMHALDAIGESLDLSVVIGL